jgi:DNA (cytosine-5)-methyltransferase 1
VRLRALDLFCGAGGATKGLQEAGFHVTGVDLAPQPRYVGDEFFQADAMEFPLDGYDLIWASPPCQAYSIANNIHGRTDHPDLVGSVRARLEARGGLWIIENVPGAPLKNPFTLCGRTFGLGVKRHRVFEAPFLVLSPPCPRGHPGDWVSIFGHTVLSRGHVIGKAKGGGNRIRRRHLGTEVGREAMGIDWMTRKELSQAIPPTYSRFIGEQAVRLLTASAKGG